MAQQANQLQQQSAQIQELMAAIELLQQTRGAPSAKLAAPEKYSGGREGLKSFLTNMDLYCRFNKASFATEQDKILAAGMHLKGDAAEWMQPLVDDFINHASPKECRDDTQRVFQDWESFKEEIQKIFGNVDEERAAERRMQALRQDKSAEKYTVEFKRLQAKIDWNDASLMAAYYQGLKDRVKDEIARRDRPNDLHEMIEIAVQIDNRLYEREQEKQKGHLPTGTTRKSRKDTWREDPMDVDMVQKDQKKNTIRNSISQEERRKRYQDKACLRCGEIGHFRRDCPKNNQRSQVGAIQVAGLQPARPKGEETASENACEIHSKN